MSNPREEVSQWFSEIDCGYVLARVKELRASPVRVLHGL